MSAGCADKDGCSKKKAAGLNDRTKQQPATLKETEWKKQGSVLNIRRVAGGRIGDRQRGGAKIG